jgi:hypothetical protein
MSKPYIWGQTGIGTSVHPELLRRCKRILILTADYGYGHRSAANAIAEALHETHDQGSKFLKGDDLC